MLIFIVISLYVVVGFFDYLPLIRLKNKKTTLVYSLFFFGSFIVLTLYTLNIEVPSPTKFIEETVYFLTKQK